MNRETQEENNASRTYSTVRIILLNCNKANRQFIFSNLR